MSDHPNHPKRPATPLTPSFRDGGWLIASILSAIVLLAGAGYWFFSTRTTGPAVGEKVEMPPSLVRPARNAATEGLRGLFRGDRPATRPANRRAAPPATSPSRN